MKYIKAFTGIIRKYWLIPTDNVRYKEALKMIGCTNKKWQKVDLTGKGKYVYFLYEKDFSDSDDDKAVYGWMEYPKGLEYLKSHKFKDMGVINIPDYEFDANNYNL